MRTALPLLLASWVIILTTCDAASGGTVGIVAALTFQCSCTCLNAFMFQTKWFVRYRYIVYHHSLHISRSFFSKQPRKDTPWLTCRARYGRSLSGSWFDQSCGFVPPAFVRYWGDRLWFTASLQYLHWRKNLFVFLWCDVTVISELWCDVTVISAWCNLCEIYSRICLLSRPEIITELALLSLWKVYSINVNDIHVSNTCFNDACLHTLSTVISTWCNLCEIYTYIFFLHKTEGCHEDGFAVAVSIVGYHIDNLRCCQWWHSWHCGSSHFSVFMHLFKCFYVSNQMVCEISLHSVPSLSPYFTIFFLQTTQKRHPMAHL